MKIFLSLLFTLVSLAAFSQAPTITFEDKDNSLPTSNPRRLIRSVDINEIKAVVNAHAALLDGKQSTLVSGTSIKTVNSTSLLGSGDVDVVDDEIVNGVTTKAPSQNIVFDELALRVLLSSFVENEVPSGTLDSINDTFTLANTPIAGSVKIYQNGIRLKGGGIDYNISGPTITFSTAPQAFDILLCDYRK